MQDSTYPMAPPPPLPPSANPYAAPVSGYGADAETIRHQLVKHEADVKAIGTFYLFGAAAFIATAVAIGLTVFVRKPFTADAEDGRLAAVLLLALFALIAVLSLWIGRGLRKLDRKVRFAAVVVSCVGLVGFPVGTLINGYFLYLLASEKGNRVLSPEYQQIVAATPHIRYTSPWLILALIGVTAIVVVAVVMTLVNR